MLTEPHIFLFAYYSSYNDTNECWQFGRELYSNSINGTIPNDLGNLTNLVSLDLYLNNFQGPIPDSLGRLTKLRFLYVLLFSLSYSVVLRGKKL